MRGPEDMAQAVADLLQQKSLISTFGDQGEWEVRTTLVANRQAWRYHSSVYLHGKERKKGFPPIEVDRTREIRQTGTVTEELLAAFAREAAEVHVARCDGIKEYLTLAPFFSQPEPRYHRDETGGFGAAGCRGPPGRRIGGGRTSTAQSLRSQIGSHRSPACNGSHSRYRTSTQLESRLSSPCPG